MATETHKEPRRLSPEQRAEFLANFAAQFDIHYDRIMGSGIITATDTDGGPFIPARMALLLAAEDFDMMAPSSRETFKKIRRTL